jgi:hypothetical protein
MYQDHLDTNFLLAKRSQAVGTYFTTIYYYVLLYTVHIYYFLLYTVHIYYIIPLYIKITNPHPGTYDMFTITASKTLFHTVIKETKDTKNDLKKGPIGFYVEVLQYYTCIHLCYRLTLFSHTLTYTDKRPRPCKGGGTHHILMPLRPAVGSEGAPPHTAGRCKTLRDRGGGGQGIYALYTAHCILLTVYILLYAQYTI